MPSMRKPRHALRLVEAPAIAPLTAWRDLKTNSLLWLHWFLENGGALPATCHHVIAERLASFIAAVTAHPRTARRAAGDRAADPDRRTGTTTSLDYALDRKDD